MGSRNSENSGSMNSEEFSDFIGHHYVAPALPLFTFEHQFQLDVATGPIFASSSGASHGGSNERVASPLEVNSGTVLTPDILVQEAQGNDILAQAAHGNPPPSKKSASWSSIVARTVIDTTPSPASADDAIISYNEDGSASVKFSREFMVQAQKQWETSIIGHFIGGNFAFKFVREQAHRLWKHKGLTGVYYSSKGYYTFRFGSMEEKNSVLNLNSIQMGGKTLYLLPWMEGSKFKRNVVDKVPCWIRLVNVPYSLWSKDSLTAIASVVGTPLKFDDATARFEPLKFANVQVELAYSALRPDFVWVTVLNVDGIEEQEKVEIQYPKLPYSCSLCKAFGHSLARCINNPERVAKRPRMDKTDKNDSGASGSNTKEEYMNSMGMVPYSIGKFCGCDVVMDEDVILEELDKENINKEDNGSDKGEDNLDEFDRIPQDTPLLFLGPMDGNVTPLATVNGFEALSGLEEDQIFVPPGKSPGKEHKKGISVAHPQLVIDLGIQSVTPRNVAGSTRVPTRVSNRKGPKLTGCIVGWHWCCW